MIHDNQLGLFRALVHPRHETWIKRWALLPRAGVAPRVKTPPQVRIVRQKRQLRAVACLRQLRPILDLPQRVDFLKTLQRRLVQHLI